MIVLFIISVAVTMAMLSWFLQQSLGSAYARFRQAFKLQASDRIGEFFLSLVPTHLWLPNLAACIATLVVSFAVLGAKWPCLSARAVPPFALPYVIRRLS